MVSGGEHWFFPVFLWGLRESWLVIKPELDLDDPCGSLPTRDILWLYETAFSDEFFKVISNVTLPIMRSLWFSLPRVSVASFTDSLTSRH